MPHSSPSFRCAATAALLLAIALPHRSSGQTSAASGLTPSQPTPVRTVARNAEAARNTYIAGAKLLEENRLADAEAAFSRAEQLDPTVPEYHVAAALALEHRVTALVQQAGSARLLGHTTQADAFLAQARGLDPHNDIILQHTPAPEPPPAFQSVFDPGSAVRAADDTDDLAGPIVPKPNSSLQTFHLHADLQTAVRQVFSSFGLRVTFDDSVTPAATPQAESGTPA